MPPKLSLIAEIEARQDEVLQQLEELNGKLERALAEFGGLKLAKPPFSEPVAAPTCPATTESPRRAA